MPWYQSQAITCAFSKNRSSRNRMNLQSIPFNRTDLQTIGLKIIEDLQRHGATMVTGLPDEPGDTALTELARNLGSPRRHNADGNYVAPIRVRPNPMRNSFGREITSQTNARFELHTDEYFELQPAHIVLLHCVHPDPDGGGLSLLCHIDDVIKKLTRDQLDKLQQPLYPHPRGLVSILQAHCGTWLVRYNLVAIEETIESGNAKVTDEAQEALSAFQAAINVSECRLVLCARDCLISDNFRVLHGRTEFRAESPRLFKRMRLNNETWPELSDVIQ